MVALTKVQRSRMIEWLEEKEEAFQKEITTRMKSEKNLEGYLLKEANNSWIVVAGKRRVVCLYLIDALKEGK